MSEQIYARLNVLSDAFARLDERAPWVRAALIVNPGKFTWFALGRPVEDLPGAALIGGMKNDRDMAFICELYALTDQAGALAAKMWKSGFNLGNPVSVRYISYDLREPRDVWLFFLLHTPPCLYHCCVRGPDGRKCPAFSQLGEGEVPVLIDNYPQVCVSALAQLKANALAAEVPAALSDPTTPQVQSIPTTGAAVADRGQATPPAEQISPVARAIGIMYDHQKRTGKLISVPKLLELMPDTSKSTLYRDPAFKSTRTAIKKLLIGAVPKGHVTQGGGVEAEDSVEEQ
jgi:hypothetical protein